MNEEQSQAAAAESRRLSVEVLHRISARFAALYTVAVDTLLLSRRLNLCLQSHSDCAAICSRRCSRSPARHSLALPTVEVAAVAPLVWPGKLEAPLCPSAKTACRR